MDRFPKATVFAWLSKTNPPSSSMVVLRQSAVQYHGCLKTIRLPVPWLSKTIRLPIPWLYKTIRLPVAWLYKTIRLPVVWLSKTICLPVAWLYKTICLPVGWLSKTICLPVAWLYKTGLTVLVYWCKAYHFPYMKLITSIYS